jgi:thioredoxin-like negative regulator of GroEL
MATFATIGLSAAATAGISLWAPRFSLSPDDRAYQTTVVASSASDAEQALSAFVRRFGTSKHLDEALLRLAQLQISRGDREAAIGNLEQIARHATQPLARTRAIVFASQARLDNHDTTSACAVLAPELTSAAAPDTTLSRQLTAMSSLCAERTSLSNAATTPDTTAHTTTPRDSAAKPSPKSASKRVAASPSAP